MDTGQETFSRGCEGRSWAWLTQGNLSDKIQCLKKWGDKYTKLCVWIEENIEETFTFYRYPRANHKHLRSTNMPERINEEIKRRTYLFRIFPNEDSCLRLIRALLVEIHEDWIEQHRYLNMELLREQNKTKAYYLEQVA